MTDISNRTLALLVGVAIIISVAGILVAQRGTLHVTGMAQYSPEANLTIQKFVEITVTDNIEFGEGAVYAADSYADLYSHNATVCGVGGCADVSGGTAGSDGGNWTFTTADGVIFVENSGNVNVNLSVTSSDTAATMIGGTSPAPLLQLWAREHESGSCEDAVDPAVLGSFTEVTGSEQLICDNFSTVNTKDEVNITAYARVPADAAPGLKTTTLTITALEAQ